MVDLTGQEGSTSQSDAEFSHFVGISIRSLVETIARGHLIKRRNYAEDGLLREAYAFAEKLFAKLQALRRSLEPPK